MKHGVYDENLNKFRPTWISCVHFFFLIRKLDMQLGTVYKTNTCMLILSEIPSTRYKKKMFNYL